MIEHIFPNRAVLEKLHAGPLSAHSDAFALELLDRGYTPWTATYAMRLLATLSTWLVQEGLAIRDPNEAAFDAFLRCRDREFRPHREDRAVLARFLGHLREKGVITPAAERQGTDARSCIREAFQQHLIGQRNLAPTTVPVLIWIRPGVFWTGVLARSHLTLAGSAHKT
jgi:hypothetical protein